MAEQNEQNKNNVTDFKKALTLECDQCGKEYILKGDELDDVSDEEKWDIGSFCSLECQEEYEEIQEEEREEALEADAENIDDDTDDEFVTEEDDGIPDDEDNPDDQPYEDKLDDEYE